MDRAVWPAALLFAALLTGLAAALLASAGDGAFTTPDESGNFLAARSLSERGSFLLAPYGSDVDPEGALGPRTHVRVSGGFAPFQTPLTPLLQSVGMSVTGTIWIASGILAGLGSAGLLLAMRQLVPDGRAAAITVFAASIHIQYWLVHQYGTAGTYLAIEGWSIYFAISAWKKSSVTKGVLAVLIHALALIARPDFAVVTSLAILAAVLAYGPEYRRVRWSSSILGLTALAVVLAAAAMLVYNDAVFGDPLRVGPAALADRFSLSSHVDVQDANPISFLGALIFPQGTPDIAIWPRSIYKYLLYTAPIFTAFAAYGTIVLLRRDARTRTFVILLLITIAIGMVTRLSEDLQDADRWSPSPRGSVSRYWLPTYLIMAGLAVVGAEQAKRQLGQLSLLIVPTAILIAIFAMSLQYAGVSVRYEVVRLQAARDLSDNVRNDISDGTAIIYSLVDDKFFARNLDTATLAAKGKQDLYFPAWSLSSIHHQLESGQIIYIYSRNREELVPLVQSPIVVIEPLGTRGLYRVILASVP